MIPVGRVLAEQENRPLPTGEPVKSRLRLLFWFLAIALGALQLWAHRNDVNPDGISYIEMAEAAARNSAHALVNAYWSPLYPALLSLVFRVFRPPLYWEFTAVHGMNFAVYLATLFCFEIFLSELLAARRKEGRSAQELQPVPEETLWIWGYLLFLWTSQFWLNLAMTNPDMIVAGLVYIATALLLRIHRGNRNWLLFVALGLVLGVAYLAKAAMFPISFLFLASAFLLFVEARGSFAEGLTKSGVAVVVFALIAAPLIIAISKDKHRLTFGDSGKIAYAEYVNRARLSAHWQGEPAETGTPVHPTRKVSSDPPIYEFAQPIAGSYPPWYDPSYWYEGIRPHFSLKGQLWVLFRSANLYLKLFSRSGALYVVFLAIILQVRKGGKWGWGGTRMVLVWLPSLGALAMYALVLVEQRYVSPFVLMLLLWILSSARISVKQEGALRKYTTPVVIIALALAIAWPVTRDLRDSIASRQYEHWQVAAALHELGIPSGAQVGSMGPGSASYWAHLAGVKIVAEIPKKDVPSFLAADSVKKGQVLEEFIGLGVKAVVTDNAAVARSSDGWQQIGLTHYYMWRKPR